MTDSFVRVPVDGIGKRIDTASLDVGENTVYRQRIVIGDNSASASFAVVSDGALTVRMAEAFNISAINTTVIVRHTSATVNVAIATPFTLNNISATVQVAGTVNIASTSDRSDNTAFTAGAAPVAVLGGFFDDASTSLLTENNIGAVRITQARAMHVHLRTFNNQGIGTAGAPMVVQLAPGTDVFGTVNNISATVQVAGTVALGAGAANIGEINGISRTVQVAVSTPFTVNNISATTTVSGVVGLTAGTANIGHLNHISATVTVAGTVAVNSIPGVILAAGTANIGTINNVSATVIVAVGTPYTINNISATTIVAGVVTIAAGAANIGVINNISATVSTRTTGIINVSGTVVTQIAPLLTIDNKAPVTVSTVAALLVSDSTLKRIRFRNSHATAMLGLGGAGITLGAAAIQLSPGDVFLETDAAGAAWYGVADTVDVIVQMQGLK